MKFTPSLAAALVQQHNLSPGTIKTWKRRGQIPDVYEAGPKQPLATSHDRQQAENMLRVLAAGKVKLTNLCELAGIADWYVVRDAVAGTSTLSLTDLVALKKALNSLRNEIKRVLAELDRKDSEIAQKQFLQLFRRKEVAWTAVLDRDQAMYDRFRAWQYGKRSWPTEDVERLKGSLLVFLTETII